MVVNVLTSPGSTGVPADGVAGERRSTTIAAHAHRRYRARMNEAGFEGCWARLDRAVEHRDQFGDEWAAFLEQHPYEVSVRVDDDGLGTVSITRHEPIPPRLPLLVGEFLYELRAALDNCLYEVAVLHSGQNPPPGESVLQFPIYNDPAGWTRNLYRLRHLSDEHREMLERIQPYNAQRQDLNGLSLLNRLARSDRHRALHLIGAFLTEGGLLVEGPPGSSVTELHKPEVVVVDEAAEIASFRIRPWTPGQIVGLQPDLVLEVEIAEMAADRPWGSLSKRLYALHRATREYIEGLAAYALGFTEPEVAPAPVPEDPPASV